MARTAVRSHNVSALVWRVLGAFALSLFVAATAAAQDATKVYDLSELSTLPRLASTSLAARLIQGSYPAQLKNSGVGGTVQMEMVVDKDGKVEPGSIEVAASNAQLAEAAKSVAVKLEFSPGKVKDVAVRSRVVLPLVYKP